jgi:hypothetical protein
MRVCPSCGEENADRARFCQACAASLEVTTSHDVRKTVTIVFTDIVRSTSLAETLDPETLRAMMSRFFAEMTVVLERHGGTVESLSGTRSWRFSDYRFCMRTMRFGPRWPAAKCSLRSQRSTGSLNVTTEWGRPFHTLLPTTDAAHPHGGLLPASGSRIRRAGCTNDFDERNTGYSSG